MGGIISKAANGIGSVLGNAFTAPFKTIFRGSCEDVCSGPWDIICFIEHLCISNLVKLLMILALCYIILIFFYLMFKVGICQCIVRSLCNMCWAACDTYWSALADVSCFLCHKLTHTKRINRRRIRDIEARYSSSDESDFLDDYSHNNLSVRRKRMRERRRNHHHQLHHHVKMKTREVSVHVKARPRRLRSSRRLGLIQLRQHPSRNIKVVKRRRLR